MFLHPETMENFDDWFYNDNCLFNRTKQELLALCLHSDFPGTKKWEANNPIWNCNIAGNPTPKQAWKDEKYLIKAINNLFNITKYCIREDKYQGFVSKIEAAFLLDEQCLEVILDRFTIAKICPRVTALAPSAFIKLLDESGLDISSGIYCPMAGFGGIIRGAERWFKERKLDCTGKIEAYDINQNFCDYFGWKQRDVLAQVIETDKTVFVCPPFGLKTERWEGTPENRDDEFKTNYLEFKDWCELIKEHVKAPQYIFIGPETKKSKNKCGLFSKSLGIQYYPEYSRK